MPKPQTDLTQGLTQDQADALWALGSNIESRAGSVLFNLGDPAERVYQVVRGKVVLSLPIQVRGSQEDVVIEERLVGETLGWSGLVPPHRFTLKAVTPMDSELAAFPRDLLLRHFSDHPEVAFAVTRNVAAVIGRRLQVFQTMWLREMQRSVELRFS